MPPIRKECQCVFEGCGFTAVARGLCYTHYWYEQKALGSCEASMSKTSIYADQYGFSGDGLPNGQPWTSGQIVNTPSPATGEQVVLTVGTNPFNVPPGTLWAKYCPPATGAAKTYKTVVGDSGIPGHPTNAFTFQFNPANLPAVLSIVATAAETGYLVFG